MTLTHFGWADFTFYGDRKERTISCSNIIDTLGDLLRALAKTHEQSCKIEFQATDESRHDFLISVRTFDDKLEFVVKKGMAGLKNENWRVVTRLRDSQAALRRAFANAFRIAIEPLGPQGYREIWGHELPLADYQSLCATAL